jgi:hypothetical protein
MRGRFPVALAARNKDRHAPLVGEPIERRTGREVRAPLSLPRARIGEHVRPPNPRRSALAGATTAACHAVCAAGCASSTPFQIYSYGAPNSLALWHGQIV